jgi:hypothetical protein
MIHKVISRADTVQFDSSYQHSVEIYYLHLQDGSKQIWERDYIEEVGEIQIQEYRYKQSEPWMGKGNNKSIQ